jgi:hypothetical protein
MKRREKKNLREKKNKEKKKKKKRKEHQGLNRNIFFLSLF